jgi:hypothetical protein
MRSDEAAQKDGQGMHRVKLYKLNNQGLWDDKGTGHVGLEFLPVRSPYRHVDDQAANPTLNSVFAFLI